MAKRNLALVLMSGEQHKNAAKRALCHLRTRRPRVAGQRLNPRPDGFVINVFMLSQKVAQKHDAVLQDRLHSLFSTFEKGAYNFVLFLTCKSVAVRRGRLRLC